MYCIQGHELIIQHIQYNPIRWGVGSGWRWGLKSAKITPDIERDRERECVFLCLQTMVVY